jgi:hypothetical protein
MAGRPSDWRQFAAAEAALRDGGPGARSSGAIRTFLKLVRALSRAPAPSCTHARACDSAGRLLDARACGVAQGCARAFRARRV